MRTKQIINPYDLYALEAALEIRDRLHESVHITILSMGPAAAEEVLKPNFYLGAERIVLLSDKIFAGSDTLATSYILQKAVEKAGTFDLILCGQQSADGDTGQVGPMLAGNLKIPFLSQVVGLTDITMGFLTCERTTDYESQVVRIPMPALICIKNLANSPRSGNIGSTVFGKGIAAGIAGLLQTGLTADCTGLQIKDGLLWQRRPAFAGDMYATIICKDRRPQMATIRAGVMKPVKPNMGRNGKTFRHMADDDVPGISKIIQRNGLKQNISPLKEAEIVVGIGMGIASKKNIEELQEKARRIGAVIGATRAVVDSGLLPAQYQIGLTGSSICPELYLACGISGSAQHMSGVSAKVLIAVNTDCNSPIFQHAQYGIVDDAMAVVPKFLEKAALK